MLSNFGGNNKHRSSSNLNNNKRQYMVHAHKKDELWNVLRHSSSNVVVVVRFRIISSHLAKSKIKNIKNTHTH